MKKILIINGPNINMIGQRETSIYGKETIEDINIQLEDKASQLGFGCSITQTNIEGEIITLIQKAQREYEGIVLNVGAYTHYSYAIRDAIASITLPCIEVHFSNIHSREAFREVSVIAPVCAGQISGFGKYSYFLALEGLKALI